MRHLPAAKELVLKIVYCGPGMAGKSSNLQAIRHRLPAERVSELVSVDNNSERSVRFDWRADELGRMYDCALRIEVHTIPGQSYYAATRRQLLQGVDGIVFVADSRREALDENIDAMNELLNNLRQLEIASDLPIVIQYNKQDLPTALPQEQLAPLLNPRGWPAFAATATAGVGIAETLDAVLGPVLSRIRDAGLPAPTAPGEAPALWLLTCWRCQNMVDAPVALPGTILPCPVCKSLMEVVDPDHGQTQAPAHEPSVAEMIEVARPTSVGGASSSTLSRSPPTTAEAAFAIAGYSLVKEIDRSPLGTRLRIRENATGRTLRALTLAPALLAQPGYRESLDPFVRMAAPLRNPHLLPVMGFHPSEEAVVVISDDPSTHRSLTRVLSRRPVIAPPQAIGLVRQIAQALEVASQEGVVHGWLRPDIVLLDEDGSVLLDELAVPVAPRLLVQELFGESASTEYYLAPEYLDENARPDVRTDMFLLGALLFRMLTGEPMVTGYNAHEALHRVIATGPRGLRDTQPSMSRELDAFHQRLVAVDRRERFKNWPEVLEALDKFGGGAKRQNLQLTRQIQRGGGGTGASARRAATGSHRRPGEATSTLSGRRSVPEGATSARHAARSAAGPSRVLVIGVVAAVVVVLGVGIAVILAVNRSAHPPAPVSAPAPSPAPSSARPAPITAKPVPVISLPSSTVAASPTAPAAVPVAPVVAAPVPAMDNMARRELLSRIADGKLNERFGETLVLISALPDPAEREAQRQQVEALHAQRREEIEGMLAQGVPTPRIGEALTPCRTVWNMPGDEEWASTVMARASSRPVSGTRPMVPDDAAPVSVPTVPPAPGVTGPEVAAPVGPVIAPESELPPVMVDAAVAAETQVVQALLVGNSRAAGGIASAQAAQPPLAGALHRLIALWDERLPTVGRVVAARSAKLRIPHPTTGELWDVAGVEAAHVNLTAPNGSASELTWVQVPPRVQARLWSDAAGVPAAGPVDQATAMIMHLLAGDNAAAALHLKRGRATMIPDMVADLELLLDLNRRRVVAMMLSRGLEAVRANNVKAANDALTDLKRLDRTQLGGREDIVARLEKLVGGRPVASARGETPLPKDLRERQAALRSANWDPIGSAYLDGTAVVLPSGSGISAPVPVSVSGYSIGIAGSGFLRIIPAKGAPLAAGINLPVPAETAFFTIRLTREGLAVLDPSGRVVDQLRTPVTPTTLILRATAEVRMSAVPQPLAP